jgi:transcription factor MYB, plant
LQKDSWTEEEDKVLIEAHKEVGNKWAEIAKRLPGRTENSLKNHWNTTRRRQFARQRTHAAKNSRGATHNTILQDYIRSLSIIKNNNNMPPQLAIPEPITIMPVSVMPPDNSDMWKVAKKEKVEVKAEDDLLPSCDSFADVYSLLFDGSDHELLLEKCSSSSFDIVGNVVFDKIDELMIDMPCDNEVLEDADIGSAVVPNDNEIVMVKKEMDLMEMISQSSSASNCAGSS